MAAEKTPKKREFVSVSKTSTQTTTSAETGKTPKSRATVLRIIAVVLWLVAIGFEALVILYLNGTLYLPGDQLMWLIIGIGLDLVCVVIGSLLWKKSNRIAPASKKNKVKFFLWNNMGVVAAVIAFLPLLILLIKNKNLDQKTKKIVTVIAAIALVAAVGLSIDYNPTSQEDLEAAQAEVGDSLVYWTRWGRSFHLDPDCHTLLNSAVVFQGAIEEAFEAKRNDPCDFCASSFNVVDQIEEDTAEEVLEDIGEEVFEDEDTSDN